MEMIEVEEDSSRKASEKVSHGAKLEGRRLGKMRGTYGPSPTLG